jgi:hypothetical protein
MHLATRLKSIAVFLRRATGLSKVTSLQLKRILMSQSNGHLEKYHFFNNQKKKKTCKEIIALFVCTLKNVSSRGGRIRDTTLRKQWQTTEISGREKTISQKTVLATSCKGYATYLLSL